MKSFLLATVMWILISLIVALLTNHGVTGFGVGTMAALVTYVFFEYMYYDEKKTAKRWSA
ncbi:hypothetical protein [Staphylococcus equorum]|uniref:hypothetical protein n=1 Tax=Staphylococcus equorum TaxID=246432 RepID=UPI003FD8A1C7